MGGGLVATEQAREANVGKISENNKVGSERRLWGRE